MMNRAPILSPLEILALKKIRETLIEHFGDRMVELKLFGSRARGQGTEESDLDLLIILRDMQSTDRRYIHDVSADVGIEFRLALSPCVVDEKTWNWDHNLGRNIRKEGVDLLWS